MLSPEENIYLKQRYHDIVENCPLCGGRKPYCACKYAFQFEYAKIKANIPISLRSFSIEDFTHPQLLKQKDEVLKYTKTLSNLTDLDNLYLCGKKGTGKSALAAWILEEALRYKKTGYYFHTLYTAKVALTKLWDKSTHAEPDCVALKSADVIVIDKIGEGTVLSGPIFEELKEIIRARIEACKVTIFVGSVEASNLTDNEKELVELCNCKSIVFSGFDYKKEVLSKVKTESTKNVPMPKITVNKKAATTKATRGKKC